MTDAEKSLKVAVGALERCTREYRYYEDEKASLDESVQNISLDVDLSAAARAHQLKKMNDQMHETTTCLHDVGNNVQRYFEKVRALRDDIVKMDAKLITRINKAMQTAGEVIGEVWNSIECEEKKMDVDDHGLLEFKRADHREYTKDVVAEWDPNKVADYLKEQGYEQAARRAIDKKITGKVFLEMTRGTVTTELCVATSAERTRLLKLLDRIKGILHTDFVYGLSFHKDHLLSCSSDGTIRRWKINAGQLECVGVLNLTGSIKCMSVRENALACVVDQGAGDKLWLIDLTSLKIIHKIGGFDNKVVCMKISNDGKFVATGGENGEVLIYGTKSGNEFNKLEGHRKKVTGVAWSPDDKQLAACSQDRIRQVRVWNVVEGKLMVKIKCKTLAYNVQWISNDKEEQLVVGEQKAVGVYSVETGELVHAIPSNAPVWATAVEPKSGKIAAGLASGRVILYNIEGKEIAKFDGHQANIRALVFRDDYLFSASNDRSVRCSRVVE